MADEHFNVFQLEHPGTKGATLLKGYGKRVQWIWTDLLTHPQFPAEVREGIRKEINCDVFAVPAIQEKIPLLTPEKREFVEIIIDRLLAGEEMNIQLQEKEA